MIRIASSLRSHWAAFTVKVTAQSYALAIACRARLAQSRPIQFDGGVNKAVLRRGATYSRFFVRLQDIVMNQYHPRPEDEWLRAMRVAPV
jgi:hypothetical protein